MIIRVEKRKRFTIISNVPIEDERLSWESLGVLCWLLSKPDGWEALRASVSNQKRGAGRDKAGRIFAELQAANYMLRRKRQRKDGRFEWFSLVFEEGFLDLNGKTVPGYSVNRTGKPTTVPSSSVEPAVAEPSLEDSALSILRNPKPIDPKLRKQRRKERGTLRAPSASPVIEDSNHGQKTSSWTLRLEEIARSAGCDPSAEFAAFKDYCTANVKEYGDWLAGFAGWIRKTEKFGQSIPVSATRNKDDRWNGCLGGDCQHRCHHKRCVD